nr:sorting nexin MVP1 [Cryptococcus depauperatus CBS 7841]
MFNAPRKLAPSLSSARLTTTFNDPLANAVPVFGDMDPWSSAPSPASSSTPARGPAGNAVGSIDRVIERKGEGIDGLTNDPPALYVSLFDQLNTMHTGKVPLAAAYKLLGTSGLAPMVIEKIIHLTSKDRSTLDRPEFFCALALVSLAQSRIGISEPMDITIEQLSAISPGDLPLPDLSFPTTEEPNQSSFTNGLGGDVKYGDGDGVHKHAQSPFENPTAFNAWSPPSSNDVLGAGAARNNSYRANNSTFHSDPILINGASQEGYWENLEHVQVAFVPEKEGWFLQKYKIESDKRGEAPVSRRYSDFVWLMDVLTKRYPFRLLPPLPPKRINPDATFLKSRRLALSRFLNALVNHPVLSTDACLNIFLIEPSFESWRKRTKVSTDEESVSKQLTTAEEMAIPQDLEEKLGIVRDHLPAVLGHYARLVALAERSLGRLQAQMIDLTRLAMATQSIGELVPRCCFRNVHISPEDGRISTEGIGCAVCEGVGRGWGDVSDGFVSIEEHMEKRVETLSKHIESLKSQRDIFLSFRDLFYRYDKLSKDPVDLLRKKVSSRAPKIESLKNTNNSSTKRPGWELELDKLVSATDFDNAEINRFLARRVFLRACMWHELSVVFHSREAAQATFGWREFVKDQTVEVKIVADVWGELKKRLEKMPVD